MGKFRLAVINTQPPHLYFGGVERRIIETTKRLSSQADITVYSGTKANFKTPTNLNGVRLVPLSSTDTLFPLDNWAFNRSLSKIAKQIDADVVEAHSVSGYGLQRAIKRLKMKKPFIQTVHGVLADEYEQAKQAGYGSPRDRVANYFMKRLGNLEEETARNADLVVTISRYSFGKIKELYGVEESKVRIVPNGVDTEKLKPAPDNSAARREFGLGDEPCVLFVGSLIPRKGLVYLVEAAKKIVKEQAKVKFLLVGEGPMKNHLEAELSQASLAGNFRFLGNLKEEQLSTIYNCADLFVLPSVQEGQGIVLLEAEASALPVVAFDIGGVNEAVRNGETGLLVERGSTEQFANAVLRLLGDEDLREKLGVQGRRYVTENYTWDLCVQRMLKVYGEALGI